MRRPVAAIRAEQRRRERRTRIILIEDLSAAHVEITPEPALAGATVLPPVGGDHDPAGQNCGTYTEPVGTGNAVHSLEHGAVWVTYRPGLPQDQVDSLTGLVEGEPSALLSPFENLAAPVVLTGWGVQLELDRADDPRSEVFLAKYLQGEQSPEPGAPCNGGSAMAPEHPDAIPLEQTRCAVPPWRSGGLLLWVCRTSAVGTPLCYSTAR